jgi:hypothetical protein
MLAIQHKNKSNWGTIRELRNDLWSLETLIRKYSARCRYNPFFRSQIKNRYYLHSRHLTSYLVYGSEGVVRVYQGDRDIRNKSTPVWG